MVKEKMFTEKCLGNLKEDTWNKEAWAGGLL
jgi:hypothetical protein